MSSFITPDTVAYDRNHGSVLSSSSHPVASDMERSPFPVLDPEAFCLRVSGEVSKALWLSLSDLRALSQHTVIAALQCAGNRRHTMRTVVKEVDGIDWNDGAVCNCTWTGPLLADVLALAGVSLEDGEKHVVFNCECADVQDDKYYGSSVPLGRCLDREKKAMLCLEVCPPPSFHPDNYTWWISSSRKQMNGAPLPLSHGFPLRVVLPGIAGARWTKWLDRIHVQSSESGNYYMQKDYKILPPHVDTKAAAEKHWPLVSAIQGLPINSIIAYPAAGSILPADSPIEVSGYALPQADDGPVVAVDISTDGGASWHPATITTPTEPTETYKWAWAIWKYTLTPTQTAMLTRGTKIWSRARDRGGNVQDGEVRWNFRGVAYNAYGETSGLKVEGRAKDSRL